MNQSCDGLAPERENIFHNLFTRSKVPMCLSSPSGELLYVNNAFQQLLGYNKSELIGKHFSVFTHEEDRSDNTALNTQIQQGGLSEAYYQKRYIHKDGSVIYTEINLTPIHDDKGNLCWIVALIIDKTANAKLQEELKEHKETLERHISERTHEVMVSQERLVRQFQISPVPTMILERTGEEVLIKDYNLALEELTEGKMSTWLLKSAVTFFHGNIELQTDIQFVLNNQVSIDRETWLQLPGHDERRQYNLRLAFIDENRALLHIEDITDIARMEQEMSLFFYTSLDLVNIAGYDGYFKRLNPRWTEVLGWTREELKSKPFIEFVHPDDRESTIQAASNLYKGNEVVHFENRYKTKDGTYRWLSWNAVSDTQREILISVARDVTDTKELEEVLTNAKVEAERANRAKSEFLANMSHEIRTPLNAVIGFSELLAGMVQDPVQKRYIDSINTSGKSLLMLINDILDMSKIEAGMLQLEKAPVDVRKLIHEVQQIFAQVVDDKNLLFRVEMAPEVPSSILADEVRLRQVLVNIIGNAVKFTEKGEIVVRVSVNQKSDRYDLSIQITDTGIGIRQSEVRHIFDSFRQQSGQSNRKYGGTGLGLSISKRLVDMMNGEILVESKTHKGSVFTVLLKGIDIFSNSAAIEDVDEAHWLETDFTDVRILIVDDDRTNRFLLKEILNRLGCTVIEADNGQVAVVVAKKQSPDLIIMDIRMPVMGGIEATQILKKMSATSDIPIIAFTASTALDSKVELKNFSFDGILQKPVKPRELVTELQKHLEVSNEKRAAASKRSVEEIDKIVWDKINGKLKPVLKDIHGGIRIRKIHGIADQCLSLGEEHGIDQLIQYGEHLKDGAESYDIIVIQQAVDNLREWLENGGDRREI